MHCVSPSLFCSPEPSPEPGKSHRSKTALKLGGIIVWNISPLPRNLGGILSQGHFEFKNMAVCAQGLPAQIAE